MHETARALILQSAFSEMISIAPHAPLETLPEQRQQAETGCFDW
jgi:hypothetical protein